MDLCGLGFEESQLGSWIKHAGFKDFEWLIMDDSSASGVFVASATRG